MLIPLSFSGLLQVWDWWYVVSNIHSSSGQIFLHYTSLFGVDLVGEWWKIFYLPIGANIFDCSHLAHRRA